jgi:hypothetical protein
LGRIKIHRHASIRFQPGREEGRHQTQPEPPLENIRGVTDRARLREPLAFERAAVAAKIVVGKHVGSKVWVRAPRLVGGAGHA